MFTQKPKAVSINEATEKAFSLSNLEKQQAKELFTKSFRMLITKINFYGKETSFIDDLNSLFYEFYCVQYKLNMADLYSDNFANLRKSNNAFNYANAALGQSKRIVELFKQYFPNKKINDFISKKDIKAFDTMYCIV